MVRPLLRWLQLTEFPRARKRRRCALCTCVCDTTFFHARFQAQSFAGMTKLERRGQCGASSDIFRRARKSLREEKISHFRGQKDVFFARQIISLSLHFVTRSYNTGKFERGGKQRVKVEIASRVQATTTTTSTTMTLVVAKRVTTRNRTKGKRCRSQGAQFPHIATMRSRTRALLKPDEFNKSD